MKKNFVHLFVTAIIIFTCTVMINAQEKKSEYAVAEWDKTEVDLGKIAQNNPAEVVFTVTNSGDVPLVIKDVKSSCGCTVPKFTKEPVLPGKSTTITAVYNAHNAGSFSKSVIVIMNTSEGSKALVIKGVVEG